MILQWSASFDQAHFAWYTFCTIALLLTFVPGTMLVCAAATRSSSPLGQISYWLPILSGCTLAWLMVIFSLAFAPAPFEGEPSDTPVMSGNIDLRDLLAEAVDPDSVVDVVCRGGWIGSLRYAGLTMLAPEGDPRRPHFPSRRPDFMLPLSSFLVYQTVVFVAVVAGLGVLVRPFLTWPRVLMFLLFWSCLVYAPLAHWVWGDGWLALRGAIDPGGGLLPLTLGVAAAATSRMGRRRADEVIDGVPAGLATDQAKDAKDSADGRLNIGLLLLCLSHLILVASFSVYVHQIPLLSRGVLNVALAGAGGCIVCSLLDAAMSRTRLAPASALGLMAGCAAAAGAGGVLAPQSALLLGCGAAAAAYSLAGRRSPDSSCMSERVLTATLGIPAALGLLIPGVLGVSSVGMQRLDGTVVTSLVDGDLTQLTNQFYAVASIGFLVFAGTAIILGLVQLLPVRTRVQSEPLPPSSSDDPTASVV